MARYIDAERLCRGLKDMASVQYPDKQKTILGVVSTIENAPTADVEEVRHGEWYYGICTNCGHEALDYLDETPSGCAMTTYITKYCPECGAKMDGERKK